MSTFSDLGVSAPVCRTLASRGITEPTEIQALVIPDALAGRDILGRSRTGSGKTLGFGLPLADLLDSSSRRPSALVLVPTRELATQVTEELTDIAQASGLQVASVYGGVPLISQARRASKAHILIATPGRMQDLIDRNLVSMKGVRFLVLDEADRMLDMGFQPQVDGIVKSLSGPRQTMFFSATLDGQVGILARSYTTNPVLHEVHGGKEAAEDAEHRFISVRNHEKTMKLVEVLKKEGGTTLVFVRTKRGADRLVLTLKAHDVRAVAMHGDLSQAARERALDKLEKGRVSVLVATDVAARGIDVDRISHVINFDPPEDDKAYVHRVGRTARAGRSGVGTTFVLPDQQYEVSRIAARLKLHTEFEDGGMTIAPPRKVFTSHRGNRSMMRPRPKRKF